MERLFEEAVENAELIADLTGFLHDEDADIRLAAEEALAAVTVTAPPVIRQPAERRPRLNIHLGCRMTTRQEQYLPALTTSSTVGLDEKKEGVGPPSKVVAPSRWLGPRGMLAWAALLLVSIGGALLYRHIVRRDDQIVLSKVPRIPGKEAVYVASDRSP